MMKKLVFILSILLVSTVACKKKGCTVENATNYNSEAKENDGSCVYEAKVSFWFKEGVSEFLVGPYDVTELIVYIEDIPVGTMDPAEWKTGPDCDGENFTVVNDLGSFSGKVLTYSVRDDSGTEQFSGDFSVIGNDCKNVELKW